MKILGASFNSGIKTNRPFLVKLAISLIAACLSAPSIYSDDEKLPDIEARTYGSQTVRKSKSGRVYLFEDVDTSKPRLGRILLFRKDPKDSENVMAFRVIKTYPDRKQFAAKKVRTYGETQNLEPGSSYTAIEKLSDRPPPPLSLRDQADIRELEKAEKFSQNTIDQAEVLPKEETTEPPAETYAATTDTKPKTKAKSKADAALDEETPPPEPLDSQSDSQKDARNTKKSTTYDKELDVGSSLPPEEAPPEEVQGQPEEDERDKTGITVDELTILDPYNHWLGGEFGFFRNFGFDEKSSFFAGGGVRYGFNVGKMMFLRRLKVQDSISLEGGTFLYKVLNYASDNDAYTVMPLIGTVRYNVHVGPAYTFFVYAGFVKNLVLSIANEPTTRSPESNLKASEVLGTVQPAGGVGMFFQVGPNWEARIDLGIDLVGMGLVLRF